MSLVGTFSSYPPARSLISALPLADALHLRRTCTSMYGLVGGLLTPPMVDRLTDLLVNLGAEQYFSLGSAPESCRRNRRFVEVAVRRDASNYQYANELRDDLLICKMALISAVQFSPLTVTELLANMGDEVACRTDVLKIKEMIIPQEKRDAWVKTGCVELVKQGLVTDDKDIVLSGVQREGMALELASEALRADKEVVMAAVTQNGMALQFVSGALRADAEVVLTAARQIGKAYVCTKKLQGVSSEQTELYGMALLVRNQAMGSDKGIVGTVLLLNGLALQYLSNEMRSNKEIVLVAVQQNGMALQFASPVLRRDREVVMTALNQNGMALRFVDKGVRQDHAIVVMAVEQVRARFMRGLDTLFSDL